MHAPHQIFRPGSANRKGFTLVELLMVIMIIAVLVGLVLGAAGYANRKAATAAAQKDIEQLRMALEDYRADYGAYPAINPISTNLLTQWNALYVPGSTNYSVAAYATNKYPSIRFVDPWANSYRYQHNPAGTNKYLYTLYSMGPDGKHNTGNPAHADNLDNVHGGFQ